MANIGTLTATLGVDSRPLVDAARKMRTFTSSARRAFGSVTRSVFNLKTALIGLIAVLGMRGVARSFIQVGRFVENMGVRLKVLLGSVEEGNLLFRDLAAYASRVPFQLEQIMASATMLAGIMKGGREQIMSWMPLIGDLAAATGLTIEKATEQMMRALSAGIGAADLFRERGISAFLGFKAGVKYTAEDTARIIAEAWTRTASRFRGATEEMAKTWDGIVSMIQDAWFRLRKTMLEAGLWDALKKGLDSVLSLAKRLEASGLIQKWAKSLGDAFGRIDWDKILNSLWEMAQIARHAYTAIRFIVSGFVKMYQWADRIVGLTEESKLIKEMESSAKRQTALQKKLNRLLEDRKRLSEILSKAGTPERAQKLFPLLSLQLKGAEREISRVVNQMIAEQELVDVIRTRFKKTFEEPVLPELPEPKIQPRKLPAPIVSGLGGAGKAAVTEPPVTEPPQRLWQTKELYEPVRLKEAWGERAWSRTEELREGLEKSNEMLKQMEESVNRVAVGFTERLGGAVADMIVAGRKFEDVMIGALRAMLAELIRVTVQVMILKPILEGLKLGGGGGIFGFIGSLFHEGGLVQRAHGGLRLGSDERLLIAQTGEAVLSRGVVSRLGRRAVDALISGNFQTVPALAGISGGPAVMITMENHFGNVTSETDLEEIGTTLAETIKTALRESQ